MLAKHTSFESKSKFYERKYKSNQKWHNDKYRCECKNLEERNTCEKDYIWNPATCSCENVEYLASATDDSMITCDEIKNQAANVVSTESTNFHKK